MPDTPRRPVLDLVEPGPVEVRVALDGREDVLYLRPFTLRDERWIFDTFADANAFDAMLLRNDMSGFVRIFCHQLAPEAVKKLRAHYDCSAAELPDALMSRLHLDAEAEDNPATAIVSAVMRSRSASFPERMRAAADDEKKNRMTRRLFRATMKWCLPFALGLAAAQAEWMRYWTGRLADLWQHIPNAY